MSGCIAWGCTIARKRKRWIARVIGSHLLGQSELPGSRHPLENRIYSQPNSGPTEDDLKEPLQTAPGFYASPEPAIGNL
jgi:hypothetical protein